MITFDELSPSSLLVDVRNARLRDSQPSQQAAILALARQQGAKLLELAKSISAGRLDPLSPLAVVRTAEGANEYIVLEGNRRIVTLKALETPALVTPAFDAKGQRELQILAQKYAVHPITSIRCAVFDTEDEAVEWIFLRHDGQSGGKGLVEWGADEKDRFRARHGSQERSPAGQIIDFVDSEGLLSQSAQTSTKGIISNLQRMLTSKPIRDVLGIEVQGGKVVMHFPKEEVAKSLTRVVEELRTDATNVGHIYNAKKRAEYASNFESLARPDPSMRLAAPAPLGADTGVKPGTKPKPGAKTKPPRPLIPRDALIPSDCRLNISPTRINLIYHELLRLKVADFANACSVLLRVFVELSVDEYIKAQAVVLSAKPGDINLAYKIKAVAAHLHGLGKIDKGLVSAMKKAADGSRELAASTVTFNQYVHSPYVHPQPVDLRSAWDELQPFMEAIWP
ncbi:hypothetical protein [Longimicrobium terrae]|uniref:ParB/Sulfiredoxin domain-containing protein n=1 Tax=Longimicrobium terrae TaxID=1639882 RepID=A0A841GTJ4_9BACT|nr:hypothetical protein [Longimicrobium terrae]MBB4635515.1 hypothetical protein [Longimicrobium terrae]MBB6069909.1 hypothetical protein [Longimicrobium terrae]NNC32822.1 hypothetical protein [Longimicrobium terrae]